MLIKCRENYCKTTEKTKIDRLNRLTNFYVSPLRKKQVTRFLLIVILVIALRSRKTMAQ